MKKNVVLIFLILLRISFLTNAQKDTFPIHLINSHCYDSLKRESHCLFFPMENVNIDFGIQNYIGIHPNDHQQIYLYGCSISNIPSRIVVKAILNFHFDNNNVFFTIDSLEIQDMKLNNHYLQYQKLLKDEILIFFHNSVYYYYPWANGPNNYRVYFNFIFQCT